MVKRDALILEGDVGFMKKKRIAEQLVGGESQSVIARRYGVSKQAIGQLVHREDMVPFIEKAQIDLLGSLPEAVKNTKKLVKDMKVWDKEDYKNRSLSFDASKLVMQAGGIVPASSQTTVVMNILNQANVVPSPQVMEILKLHGKAMDDFVDVKELEGGEK